MWLRAVGFACDGCVMDVYRVAQRLSEVTGGAHSVLRVRGRQDGKEGGEKALKVVPLSQLRQIQREVR